MLLLMARLGLRAAEVIAIQLDDIDWRAGELLVRGKGKLHDRLPITVEVGDALSRYLREERGPATCRTMFVTPSCAASTVQGRADRQRHPQGCLEGDRPEAGDALCGIAPAAS